LTLFELAQLTTKVFGLNEKLLKAAKSSDFENLAPRPVKTIFDLSRIKNEFNLKMSNPLEGLTELMITESN
jgi:dTDP-4-dehydrorhamnose reductase